MRTTLILLTSLGGNTLAWHSAMAIGLMGISVSSLVGFIWVENWAADPLLPLYLFGKRVFAIACAVGFIVGLALFGSLIFMPMYLQIVKDISPTDAGMTLTPMMAGVLVTSIGSGRIISRIGKYRPFPIIGTAVVTLGLGLSATLGTTTSVWATLSYMVILGLGLGLVMQVLLLAAQNAVDYRDFGVATSGTTLFRSIGGSIGVSLFGAMFTGEFVADLHQTFPGGASLPSATALAAIKSLSSTTRALFASVHGGAGLGVSARRYHHPFGFALAWL